MTATTARLTVPRAVMDAIRTHLEGGYPNEACGALIGAVEDGDHAAVEFRPMRNTEAIRPHDRYTLDPLEQLRVQRDAEGRGLEIVGFVHSHPDHPARPSQFDTEHAWPFYSYVVASVERGRMTATQAFRLNEALARFEEESISIL